MKCNPTMKERWNWSKQLAGIGKLRMNDMKSEWIE